MDPSNFADERYAGAVNALQSGLFGAQPAGYNLDPPATCKDWDVEDTANLLFRESYTDVAIYHPVPIYFYKESLDPFRKAVEATKRWPNRFVGAYCTIDPLSSGALDELDRPLAHGRSEGGVPDVRQVPRARPHEHRGPQVVAPRPGA
jgi:hypothetical protein